MIDREHAKAEPQHASGASGPGRILFILGRVEKTLLFDGALGRPKNNKDRPVEQPRVEATASQDNKRTVWSPGGSLQR